MKAIISAIISTLLALLSSKKATILGGISAAAAAVCYHKGLPCDQWLEYMKPLAMTYIGAQGLQDGLAAWAKRK